MNFKYSRVFFGIFSASLFIFASGCGRDLGQIVQRMQTDLGIPVTSSADNHDPCLLEQLERLGRDFRMLPTSERQQMAAQLRTEFAGIHFAPTQTAQTVRGEASFLMLVQLVCWGSSDIGGCDYIPYRQKVLADSRQTLGNAPITQISTTNRTLTLTAQNISDETTIHSYLTQNQNLFERVSSMTSETFLIGQQLQAIWLSRNIAGRMHCGQSISLRELIRRAHASQAF